jgi:tetratricopeptide (TPR) repeat protein
MYIASVAARRSVEAKDPNVGYVRGLRALLAKYPKEVEARSYLALHIMSGFVLPSKKPRAGTMEAVEILRALTTEVPDHPGVHHYVIHGWEGSTFAKDAWPSCKRYGELANNIPHGLHMPGHIYAQTGKWDEAVKSFGDAAANEIYWMKQDSLGGNGHHGHNVHFLASSYSFRGDFEKALEAATSLLAYKETPREQAQVDNYRTAYRQGWFAVMRVLVQHEKWDRILDGKTLPAAVHPRQEAWQAWARALAHLAKPDRAAAGSEVAKFEAALTSLAEKTKQARPEPLIVAQTELQAHLSEDKSKRLKLLDKAAKLELALRYTEPTSYPRPVLEILGQEALRQGQPKHAERAFRMALEQYPESAGAKAGLRLATERRTGPVTAGLD